MKAVYRRRESIVTREIAGETFLVPISGDLAGMEKFFSLNATGAAAWARLDGRNDLEAVLGAIVEEFDVGRETARADLAELIAGLAGAGLVEEARR